jgi:hypothetical protein
MERKPSTYIDADEKMECRFHAHLLFPNTFIDAYGKSDKTGTL